MRTQHSLIPAATVPMVLFVTVQDTARSSARRQRSGQPEAYDFRRPMTLAREHGRVFEMAFETFARQWGTQLTRGCASWWGRPSTASR